MNITLEDLLSEILKLKKKVRKLESNFVPNQDLKDLKKRLIKRVKKGYFTSFELDTGVCSFSISKLYQMIQYLNDKGEFYILLSGSRCDLDIGLWDFNDYLGGQDVESFLFNLNTKRLYSKKIPEDSLYLIALDTLSQKKILNENIIMFLRK